MKAKYHITCSDRSVSANVNQCFQNVHGALSDLSVLEGSAETVDYCHMERRHRTSREVVIRIDDKNHTFRAQPAHIVWGMKIGRFANRFHCS